MRSPMKALSELSGRLKNIWQLGQAPPEGKVFSHSRALDAAKLHLTDGLTFTSLKGYVRALESGDLATTLSFYEELEERDLHLQSVANTRRAALTGKEWEVVPATEVEDRRRFSDDDEKLAEEAADFVREELALIEEFDEAMEHLSTAIGTNIAVAELVWERNALVGIDPIPSHRLRLDTHDPSIVRVITEEERLGRPALAAKFIVHSPRFKPGFRFSGPIMAAQAQLYLVKILAIADWSTFTELYGMPARWGTYQGTATPEEKAEMLEMLEKMGSAGYGLFSSAFTLNYAESSQRGTVPYEALINWCERKQSIGWLGQHMTTDTSGATGTRATASVQDEVRQDLLEDDVRKEGRTIRRQLFGPLCAFKWPGREVPLPIFRRKFREEVDRSVEADVMIKGQQLGMKISAEYARETLGIPKPGEGDEILAPLASFNDPVMEGFGAP